MRLLLMLEDAASQTLCDEYFSACGHDSDVADGSMDTEGMLQFRKYDFVVADLPRDAEVRDEALRLIDLAHRRNPALRSVLLTTGRADLEATPEWLTVMTKPQRLDTILQAAVAR